MVLKHQAASPREDKSSHTGGVSAVPSGPPHPGDTSPSEVPPQSGRRTLLGPPPLFLPFFFFLPLPLQPEEETLSDRRSEMTREPSWKATPARTRGGEEKATNWKGGE